MDAVTKLVFGVFAGIFIFIFTAGMPGACHGQGTLIIPLGVSATNGGPAHPNKNFPYAENYLMLPVTTGNAVYGSGGERITVNKPIQVNSRRTTVIPLGDLTTQVSPAPVVPRGFSVRMVPGDVPPPAQPTYVQRMPVQNSPAVIYRQSAQPQPAPRTYASPTPAETAVSRPASVSEALPAPAETKTPAVPVPMPEVVKEVVQEKTPYTTAAPPAYAEPEKKAEVIPPTEVSPYSPAYTETVPPVKEYAPAGRPATVGGEVPFAYREETSVRLPTPAPRSYEETPAEPVTEPMKETPAAVPPAARELPASGMKEDIHDIYRQQTPIRLNQTSPGSESPVGIPVNMKKETRETSPMPTSLPPGRNEENAAEKNAKWIGPAV